MIMGHIKISISKRAKIPWHERDFMKHVSVEIKKLFTSIMWASNTLSL